MGMGQSLVRKLRSTCNVVSQKNKKCSDEISRHIILLICFKGIYNYLNLEIVSSVLGVNQKKPIKKKNNLNVLFSFNDNGSGLAPRLRVVVIVVPLCMASIVHMFQSPIELLRLYIFLSP